MLELGRIKVSGPFPPPVGIVGPGARTTAHHIYQIFDGRGVKIASGSDGPDTAATIEHAKRLAAEKGCPRAVVEREVGQ